MLEKILIFIISIFTTTLTVPLIKSKAEKLYIIDVPDFRKQHDSPKVRLGGVSIFIGFISSLLIYDLITADSFVWANKDIILLSIGFFFLGLFDDLFKLSASGRLFVQFILATIAWSQNIRVSAIDFSILNIPEQYFVLPLFVSYLITVFWIVGTTNAINWMDGLDGLAAGIIFISSIGISLVAFKFGQSSEIVFLTIISGTCLGFLKSNFFPSKILMGDGGSYFLGFTTAILSLNSASRIINQSYSLESTSILLPLIILSVPLIDMTYVIFSRLVNGNSPFYPDRTHLHHRMINKGIGHKRTVLYIYISSLINVLVVSLII